MAFPETRNAALILLVALGWAGQAVHAADAPRGELAMDATQSAALGVQTAPVSRGGPPPITGLPATVSVPPAALHVVSAPLAGLVAQVGVAAGDIARRGQLLARMDSPALLDAQRGYLQADAQLALARRSDERDRQLLAEGLIAESRAQATRSRLDEQQAALTERRQALRLAGMPDAALERLRETRALSGGMALSSPIAGVVLEQAVSAGQRVEAGAMLFRIARLDALVLEIQLPAARLPEVSQGAEVHVNGTDVRARVSAIGRAVNPATQSVTLRAAITPGAGGAKQAVPLSPGQLVEVQLARSGAEAWRVPATALTRIGEQPVLFVRSPRGYKLLPVRVLHEGDTASAGGFATVDGALTRGDAVAVRGVAALKAALAVPAADAAAPGAR